MGGRRKWINFNRWHCRSQFETARGNCYRLHPYLRFLRLAFLLETFPLLTEKFERTHVDRDVIFRIYEIL
ncbi:hypothetical protein L596_002600 [Steinernema carpocapsae]|uniref:Uncharacterized protein n=1 Tax=Steinernema carpocapsae TaxID=34508 RepID=A0A4U8UPP2_STECR|nr:hypothetical protein L596_002600 [Steinernema carpocapsae]